MNSLVPVHTGTSQAMDATSFRYPEPEYLQTSLGMSAHVRSAGILVFPLTAPEPFQARSKIFNIQYSY